MICKS